MRRAAALLRLQAILLAGAGAAASPLRPPSSSSSLRVGGVGTTASGARPRRSRRRRVAFAVPRGGAAVDAVDADVRLDDDDGGRGSATREERPRRTADPVDFDDGSEEAGNHRIVSNDDDDDGRAPSRPSLFLPYALFRCACVFVRASRRACSAGVRAVWTGDAEHADGGGRDDDASSRGRPVVRSLIGRTARVFGEMRRAALTPPGEGGGGRCDGSDAQRDRGNGGRKRRRRRKRKSRRRPPIASPTTIVCNGGGIEPSSSSANDAGHAILQLAKEFEVDDLPVDEHGQLPKKYTQSILLGLSLPEALKRANADARFLICYISKGGKNGKNDAIAIPNLLAPDVVKSISRRPLGTKQSGDSASFHVWIARGEKEADAAMKRLKVKPPAPRKGSSKKSKSSAPVLAIVYPATAIGPSGKPSVSPRVLAQHHCRPPPSSPENLVAWTTSIRKRHLREFAKLQHDRKEMQLLRERTEGYASSLKEDAAREEEEERELQLKKEEEERERERKEAIEERRKGLLEALAEEPEAGEGIITVALRFADGGRDQRRFAAGETTTNDLCDWVDAVHGLEREKVQLSTMNGSKRFVYHEGGDVTLEEAGLGKMTALRVSEIAEAKEEEEEGGEEGESEYEDEED